MKKRTAVFSVFLALFAIALIIGCSEDKQPVIQTPEGPASIEVRVPYQSITGNPGQERSFQITGIVRDANGVGLPNQRLRFGIADPETYKGSIATAQADSVTNEHGQLVATYSVVLEQTTDVTIEARIGQVYESKTIHLDVRYFEGNLSLEAQRRVLTVRPGRTAQTTVTATLIDTSGLAIPGVEVKFRTMPATMGVVDSDTGTTNSSGRVQRTFTSIVDNYGPMEVVAEVGEITATESIEIRSVAGPSAIVVRSDRDEMRVAQGVSDTTSIEAIVTDRNGHGVPGTPVEFRLEPISEGGRTFGALSGPDTTDMDGRIVKRFTTLGKYGDQWVVAEVLPSNLEDESEGPLQDQIRIVVEQLTNPARGMTNSARPRFINLDRDEEGQSTLRVVVTDDKRNGISGLAIDYEANYGTVSGVTATDSMGVSSAYFAILPETDFTEEQLGAGQPIDITIAATIRGTNTQAVATVTVMVARNRTGTLNLSTNKSFIYADNGLTTAQLTAVLKDQDGQSLSGEEIIFTATHGAVNSPVLTDSLGRALAVFTDIGIPSVDPDGNPEPSLIKARNDRMGIEAQVEVTIRERNPVSSINLTAGASQMVAGRGDSTSVRATCRLASDDPAPNGTLVNFEARLGVFTSEAKAVTGNFGAAETFYIAGNQVGVDTLVAWVDNGEEERVYSNEVLITMISGPPSIVSVTANPRELTTNDPEAFSTITASVMDTVGNPVRQGLLVTFTTTLGTITSSAITDEEGRAVARLSPGVNAGVAQVTASIEGPGGAVTGQTTVTFISGTANTIQLEADPLEIQVAGTGGISTSTLRATVRDANGNLVEAATTVVFELINEPGPPAGCNINNRGLRDSSRTANGVAVASLNSGEQIGGKLVRAYTWRDTARTDTVSVILSTVAVVAGPPFQLDIDVNDGGQDAGGGAWVVEVSARVWDIHRNPVANRIPVVFTVEPEIANITPGYTGNDGLNGSPTKGLAYAAMVYNSVNTFDPIEISAEVQTREGLITGSREHILPMQEGNLELNVDPGNWMFEEGNEEAEIRVWGVLKDGHEILINNAPVLFTSNRGRFFWFNFRRNRMEMFYPDPSKKFTGVVDQENNEEPGQATVFLIVEEPDIFLDPFTLEVTVQINANVEGYDDVSADPGFIFFTRRGR